MACTSLFDTGNAVVCTGGSYAVAVSVAGKGGAGDKHQIRRIVIQLLKSIPFDCYVIMTALTMAGLCIPVFMDQVAETVGNANTFLSMTMIGLGLELHMTREQTGSVARSWEQDLRFPQSWQFYFISFCRFPWRSAEPWRS